MANGLSTDFPIIEDLPRDFLNPRCSLKKEIKMHFAITRLEQAWYKGRGGGGRLGGGGGAVSCKRLCKRTFL